MRLFLDTSGLYALEDSSDAWHVSAREFWEEHIRADPRSVVAISTHLVFWEVVALVQRHLGPLRAYEVGRKLIDSDQISWIGSSDFRIASQALLEIRSRRMPNASFVDHTSFFVMRENGFQNVFTYDDDFREAGFVLVPGKNPAV
ncbi:MAG: PIN domain-containing protein [Planctomycetota bacterium]|nr:PIN domain-containing protein [Planctomycetota bacterium]